MVIQFSHPKPREHLLKHGHVYTFRTKRRKREGRDWASSGRGSPKIADVDVKLVEFIPGGLWGRLKRYYKDSGFGSVAEWITAIMNVKRASALPVPLHGFLYRVEVIKS